MCTAFTLNNSKAMFFGRNMDIDSSFGEHVVVTPQNYAIATKCAGILSKHYALIGMANVTDNYPLYADAVNEKGLCMAGLNFPDNAFYFEKAGQDKIPLAPYELIPYVLAKCDSVEQAVNLLQTVDVVAIPFCKGLPLSTLHWIIADNKRSVTVEPTAEGLKIYDNIFGVLTNNPPFPFHCENIKQYLNLSAKNTSNMLSEMYNLRPFAQGMGAVGLPGDYSSVSRFVKTVYGKANSICTDCTEQCITQVFHILDSVKMIEGSVLTDQGKPDITMYSSCIDTKNKVYYYKTYGNSRLTKVVLDEQRASGTQLTAIELNKSQDIAEQ